MSDNKTEATRNDFMDVMAIQQICGYLINEHGHVTRAELRNWVETWLDAYCPKKSTSP